MNECLHSSAVDIGVDADGGTIYRCESCGEVWNGGFEDDAADARMIDPTPEGWEEYEAVSAAQHAANPHRLEGEL